MPYIHTHVSIPLPVEKEMTIKKKLGEAITLIPGKSENRLMLEFDDECRMHFRGSQEKPIAFVEVRLFGKADPAAYDRLTAAVTEILFQELSIPPDQVFVQYQESEHWGHNGKNL